jgi:hypothetical protein
MATFKRILDIFLEPERWGKRRGQVGEHSPSPRAGEPPQEETLQVQVKMYQAGEQVPCPRAGEPPQEGTLQVR